MDDSNQDLKSSSRKKRYFRIAIVLLVILGLNLAVVYGMGLIVLAIVMGLVYNQMCTKKEDELNGPNGEKVAEEEAK